MPGETLQSVVNFERELQKTLRQERARADAWLEVHRRELDERFQQAIASLKRSNRQAVEQAREESDRQRKEIVRSARQEAEQLDRLEQKLLAQLVRDHLPRILPEQ